MQNSTARARSAKACRNCRALKARCLPSSDAGSCQRCLGAGRECTWPDDHKIQRKRGPSRIIQVERKLDSLVTRLGSQESPTRRQASAPSPVLPVLDGPANRESVDEPNQSDQTSTQPDQSQRAHNQDIDALQELAAIHDFSKRTEDGYIPNPAGSFTTTGPSDPDGNAGQRDVFRYLVPDADAESLLDQYRSMSSSFPFVPIPEDMDAHALRIERPMLFLAVLTAASWQDRSRQKALDQRYREELAQRTIVRPRKSLSLTQSLLVYLAWYHFYFSHRTQNILPLLHMLVGLVLDLGLNQKHKPPMVRKRPCPPVTPSVRRQEQRTLLGCYYVAAAISSGLHKPSLLGYSPYISECCRDLENDLEYESDLSLPLLVRIRQLDQRIYDELHAIIDPTTGAGAPDLAMRPEVLKGELLDWKEDCTATDHRLVHDLSYHYAQIEICLSALFFGDDDPDRAQADVTHVASNSPEKLGQCLESAKGFLDVLLAWPVDQYHLISFVEWMRLPRVIITVCRLTFPGQADNLRLRPEVARDYIRLDLYLESLCYRMQTLGSFATPTLKNLDFWGAMQRIMELIRAWYVLKMQPSIQTPSQSSFAPDLSSINSVQQSTAASSTGGVPAGDAQADACYAAAHDSVDHQDVSSVPHSTSNLGANFGFEFDVEQFMDMDFWGGASSYDHTIRFPGDFDF